MMQKQVQMPFRSDINGLRALAVMTVLLYHFGVPGFGGGYVGVDVFFVISGFLMTQIIATKLAARRFTLPGFYAARVRRIVPALAALAGCLVVGGFFCLTPADYRIFGRHAVAALDFTSNFTFAHRGGYFDTASHEEWLLHTWSLSVEAQFYLLFPFFLMGVRKFIGLRAGVAILLAASLIFSIIYTPYNQTAAFYLLPARCWEFLAGGMVFLAPLNLPKKFYLEKYGIALIVAAACFYSGDLAYPGYWALLPVLGAVLVIAAQSKSVLLANRPAQFLGEISYSLYLWHWPVIVAAKYFGVSRSPLMLALLVFVAVVLAWASYKWVETPLRHANKGFSDKKSLAVCLGGCAAVALAAYIAFSSGGLPLRVPEGVRIAEAGAKDVNPRQGDCLFDDKRTLPECKLGADVTPSAVLWGDSHADSVFTVFSAALKEANRGGIFYGYSACPPLVRALYAPGTKPWGKAWRAEQCKYFNQDVYENIIASRNIRDVFMVSRWSVYLEGNPGPGTPAPLVVFDGLDSAAPGDDARRADAYHRNILKTTCALTKRGKNVYLLMPVAEMDRDVPAALAKARMLGRPDPVISVSMEEYNKREGRVIRAFREAAERCGVHILDERPYLCDPDKCNAVKDGKPLYHDDHHLNEYGSRFLQPLFSSALQGR